MVGSPGMKVLSVPSVPPQRDFRFRALRCSFVSPSGPSPPLLLLLPPGAKPLLSPVPSWAAILAAAARAAAAAAATSSWTPPPPIIGGGMPMPGATMGGGAEPGLCPNLLFNFARRSLLGRLGASGGPPLR